MRFLNYDLFELWRLLIATICTIYALVISIRSLLYIAGAIDTGDKHAKIVRRYLLLHLLRLRSGRFKRELAGIGTYGVLLVVLLILH